MNSLLFIILVVFYFYMIVSAISVLLLENRNPVRSLSWVLVLVLLPVIGILLYFLIGQNYRKQKIISKKASNTKQNYLIKNSNRMLSPNSLQILII